METLEVELKSALLEFNSEKVKEILVKKVDNKFVQIPVLIEKVLSNIGEEWEKGDLSLSHVYMSGQICEKLVNEIFRQNPENETNHIIAIVTFNDFHSLGRKIVYSVLKSLGFYIRDLGNGLDIPALVDRIEKEKIEILLISVLMLPSALKIKELRRVLDSRNNNLKILVGGAPFIFDDKLWKEVRADAMAKNAVDAADIIRKWQSKN